MNLEYNRSELDALSVSSQKPFWNKITSIFSQKNSIKSVNQDPNIETDVSTPKNSIPATIQVDENNVLHIVIDNYPAKIEVKAIAKDIFVAMAPVLFGAVAFYIGTQYYAKKVLYSRQDKIKESKKVIMKHFKKLVEMSHADIIKQFRDEGMHGQDKAVSDLAVWIKDHAVSMVEKLDPNFDTKSNNIIKRKTSLFLGPSGSGKTEAFKIIKKILGVPVVFVDAAAEDDKIFGDSIKDAFKKLCQEENGEYGLLVIDEAGKGINAGSLKPSKLHTLLEQPQHVMSLDPANTADSGFIALYNSLGWELPQKTVYASTIFIESFSAKNKDGKNLEDIVIERDSSVKRDNKDWVAHVDKSDIDAYGFTEDIANRLQLIKFSALSQKDFAEILKNPSKDFKSKKESVERELNINIVLTEDVINTMTAQEAFLKRGGRSLGDALRDIYSSIYAIDEIVNRPDKLTKKIDYILDKKIVEKVAEAWNKTQKISRKE